MIPRCAALAALLAGLAACKSTLPSPPTGPHVAEEPVLVPYPPPAARVEVVPPPPEGQKGAVWIDGEWMWKGRRWVWQPGQWVVPYPGSYYAPPATVRLSDHQIAWFAGSWQSQPRPTK